MSRITLFIVFAIAVLTSPLASGGQEKGKVYRIGYVGSSPPRRAAFLHDALRQGLRELGYVEGENIVIEWRSTEGRSERLAEVAAEFVRLNVDVIIASQDQTAKAVQHATTTIPIVVVISADPVGSGLVASLARPGGNITGSSAVLVDLGAKRLELLKEAVPAISRVGFLYRPEDTPVTTRTLENVAAAAQRFGLTLHPFGVRDPGQLDSVFAQIARERTDALQFDEQPFIFRNRPRIMELVAASRLPVMTGFRRFVKDGALMSYGINLPDLWRRAAYYVDRILNGEKPADIPVEQPTHFELWINLKTAKALGLTIPQSVLVRADEIIE